MPRTGKTKTRKNNGYKNVTKLYNTLLSIYLKEYNNITDEKKKRLIKIMILPSGHTTSQGRTLMVLF